MAQAEHTFKPYGDVWSSSGLALNQGFTGHTWDAALGMYHTAFRHYSPGMARWMSRDPLGMVDGPNLYGYVGGDPVNGVDPDGLKKKGQLPECIQILLQGYFDSDLSKVTVVEGHIPRYVPDRGNVEGFGGHKHKIWLKDKIKYTVEGLGLIAHELVHNVQTQESHSRILFGLKYWKEDRKWTEYYKDKKDDLSWDSNQYEIRANQFAKQVTSELTQDQIDRFCR